MEEKIKLFTLENCPKCEYVKQHIPLEVDVDIITYPHNPKEWTVEQIVEANQHEVYSMLKQEAPILWVSDGTVIQGSLNIKKWLEWRKKNENNTG
ncbi:MAG TPA: hypothetical protein ENI51_10245 [Candidatus Atribacteria bacterium]|nr:hypothetical protein [Candidatus Atribacteria bacterium]